MDSSGKPQWLSVPGHSRSVWADYAGEPFEHLEIFSGSICSRIGIVKPIPVSLRERVWLIGMQVKLLFWDLESQSQAWS